MKRKTDKERDEITQNAINQVESLFSQYFGEYYLSHREIKGVSYYKMSDSNGYCAVLEYKNFKQYVNYICDYFSEGDAVINSCFEFEMNGRFLCNFDDVLDMCDSDDLSFYTYTNCFDEDKILSAVKSVMSATEKYYASLCSIAGSDTMKKKYLQACSDRGEVPADKIENACDITYIAYYKSFLDAEETSDDYYKYLKKDLSKRYRRNQLESPYEKRAYRVLNGLSAQDLKRLDKELEDAGKIPKKDLFIMYLPIVLIAIAFAALFAALGYYIDGQVFSGCIGRNPYTSVLGFGFAGVCLSLIVSVLLPPAVYKPLVKKDRYDAFIRLVNTRELHGPKVLKIVVYAFVILGCLGISAFFISFFCFNGMAFSDESIKYKEYAFSQMQEYSLKSTEIAVVEGSYSDGEYYEYIDTAYAFKLNGEWYDYGVADSEVKEILEKSISQNNTQVKKYKSIEDIT